MKPPLALVALVATAAGVLPPARGLQWLAGTVGQTWLDEQKSWVSLAIPGGCTDFRSGCNCTTCRENIDAAWRGGIPSLARMPETGVFRRPTRYPNGSDSSLGGLVDGWQGRLQAWAHDVVLPAMANGSVKGVFLGDEICCHNSSCWRGQLYPMSAHLRQLLGSPAILYTNECQDSLTGGNYSSHGHAVGPPLDKIAPDLDVVSVDLCETFHTLVSGFIFCAVVLTRCSARVIPSADAGYAPGSSGTDEVTQDRAFFDKEVFPRLSPHQTAAVIPGVFACSNFTYESLEDSEGRVVAKLQGYWEWAQVEPKLHGMYPWHFTNRSGEQSSGACDMRVGAVAMPKVLAKLAEIARSIKQQQPPGSRPAVSLKADDAARILTDPSRGPSSRDIAALPAAGAVVASPWIDTMDGIHLFSLWGRGADGPTDGWGTGGKPRCEYVWGSNAKDLIDWRAQDKQTVVSHYIPYARDPDASHTTAWWMERHPEMILYKCDRKTVARSFDDKNMQLDFSSEAVVLWQLNGSDNNFSIEALAAQGYDAIAADNYGFANAWGACGVYRDGKWVQLYNPHRNSQANYTQANVWWIQKFYSGLTKIMSARGVPMLLTPNWGISGSERWDDPNVLAVGNATDGALSECGFTGCASRLSTGFEWEQKVRFMLNLQAHGKAYMDNSYWGCNSTNTPAPHPRGWGAPLAMNHSSISYILASYLMGKAQAASLYIAPDDCFATKNGTCDCPGLWQKGGILSYPEFRADVGRPSSEMRMYGNSSTTAGGVWLREYSKGLILINTQPGVLDAAPAGSGVAVTLPSGKQYKDLWGQAVQGSVVKLPPLGAAVLLLG